MLATLMLIAQLAAAPADLAFMNGNGEGGQGALRFAPTATWARVRGHEGKDRPPSRPGRPSASTLPSPPME